MIPAVPAAIPAGSPEAIAAKKAITNTPATAGSSRESSLNAKIQIILLAVIACKFSFAHSPLRPLLEDPPENLYGFSYSHH